MEKTGKFDLVMNKEHFDHLHTIYDEYMTAMEKGDTEQAAAVIDSLPPEMYETALSLAFRVIKKVTPSPIHKILGHMYAKNIEAKGGIDKLDKVDIGILLTTTFHIINGE